MDKNNNSEKEIWKYKSSPKSAYSDFFKIPQNEYLWSLIKKYGKLNKKTIALEAGCGWGYYVKRLSNDVNIVYGLDFEEKMLDTCKKMCLGNKNIKFIKGDVRKLPFKDNTFDIVLCFGVVEHFDESLIALKEIRRVLKKEGVAFISVPSKYDISGRILRHIAMFRKKTPYYFQKHYYIKSFYKLLTNAGLKINNMTGYGDGIGNIPSGNKIINFFMHPIKKKLRSFLIILQKKDSRITPYFSHMLLAICKK